MRAPYCHPAAIHQQQAQRLSHLDKHRASNDITIDDAHLLRKLFCAQAFATCNASRQPNDLHWSSRARRAEQPQKGWMKRPREALQLPQRLGWVVSRLDGATSDVVLPLVDCRVYSVAASKHHDKSHAYTIDNDSNRTLLGSVPPNTAKLGSALLTTLQGF